MSEKIQLNSSCFANGEGCANLLELSALSVSKEYAVTWQRDVMDLTELARKRWVERLSMDAIAAESGWGRTAVIRYLKKIRGNPDLVSDGRVRALIKLKKHRFMGD